MSSRSRDCAGYYAGKVAIVTGASSGIGQALVVQLIAEGAQVFAVGRDAQRLDNLYGLTNAPVTRLVTGQFDVQDDAACRQLVDHCLGHFGRIDLVFCNAGRAMKGVFMSADSPLPCTGLMRTNYDSVVYLAFHTLAHLIQTQGHLTVTGGIVSHVGLPGFSAYCASKHAVRGFIESLRREVTGLGVTLTLVSPDTVRTAVRANMQDACGHPDPTPYGDEKLMSAEQCADKILEATRRKKRHVWLSTRARLLNCLQFAFPGLAQKILALRY